MDVWDQPPTAATYAEQLQAYDSWDPDTEPPPDHVTIEQMFGNPDIATNIETDML